MPEEKMDRAKIMAEMEALQLEETRDRVRVIRLSRAQKAARTASLQKSLNDTTQRQRLIQSRCAHKKGGKGINMLFSGNDANYAVVKFTCSHGPTIVVCQRCIRLWEPPDRKLNTRRSTPEQRAEYKRLWDEYQWALNLPTDNEPGGAKLFEIHGNEDAA
jgi:hypothetical protein